jgi:DNA-binding GntR family transcriptional regulator
LKKGSNAIQAYQLLKKKIITSEIKPGEHLDEKKLMEELGIGRTPLREAILLLKNEKFLEGQPNKPSYVKETTLKGAKDLLETLVIIERDATFLAAQRINDHQLDELKKIQIRIEQAIEERNSWEIISNNIEFHLVISHASDNEYIQQFHRIIRNVAQCLSYLSVSHEINGSTSLEEHNDSIMAEHRKLIACLENRDLERIEALSIEHIKHFQNRILNYLSYDGSLRR